MGQGRIRFEEFELDLQTGELHRQSRRIPLQDKPARLLTLLASRPGELVTRNEIQETLWDDGEFVEFEHAVNVAIRKIRVALEDNPDTPRIIQTLPRKGYRFIAVVGIVEPVPTVGEPERLPEAEVQTKPQPSPTDNFVLPVTANRARLLFVLAQVPYVATYLAAFYNWYDLDEALTRTFGFIPIALSRPVLQLLALLGFTVRVYLIPLVAWNHPEAGRRYRRLFPYLFTLDALWAATPLLVQRAAGPLVSWAGLILMGWLVFGQRTLMKTIERSR